MRGRWKISGKKFERPVVEMVERARTKIGYQPGKCVCGASVSSCSAGQPEREGEGEGRGRARAHAASTEGWTNLSQKHFLVLGRRQERISLVRNLPAASCDWRRLGSSCDKKHQMRFSKKHYP